MFGQFSTWTLSDGNTGVRACTLPGYALAAFGAALGFFAAGFFALAAFGFVADCSADNKRVGNDRHICQHNPLPDIHTVVTRTFGFTVLGFFAFGGFAAAGLVADFTFLTFGLSPAAALGFDTYA